MKYTDYIYGEIEISEPVVVELVNSQAMQRLKGIDQHGYLHNPKNIDFCFDKSRFSHSLGVYMLLKRFGAPLEEQIAGLLHDVSHSAFSHCIDLLKGSNVNQDYQDSIHDEYIKNTEIPDILKKYGIDLGYILDDSHFPLKERSSPDLCADRVDYILRDAMIFKEITKEKADYFLDNLVIKNNIWVFKAKEPANEFRKLFSMINEVYYAGFVTVVMFYSVTNYIRHALQKQYINETDLYTTDKEVIEKINKNLSHDSELKNLFDQMQHRDYFENNPENFEEKVTCKSRVVDPSFLEGDRIVSLSQVDMEWKEKMKIEKTPKTYYIHFTKS